MQIPNYITQVVNGDTKIVNGYFDMDKKEFIPKCELQKRFSNPLDYYITSHAYDEERNEHQVLWVYSKKYFSTMEGVHAARRVAFSKAIDYT